MSKKLLPLIFFFFISTKIFAEWIANADFSSCPRKYIPNTSGTEGAFNSESDCLSRVSQVKRESNLSCASYSCVNQAGAANNNSTTNSTSSGPLDKSIGDAINAGMQGRISPTDALGLATMGALGNALLAPAPVETQEQREARIAAEMRAQEYARQKAEQARQEEEAYQYSQNQNALAFLDTVSASVTAQVKSPPQSGDFRGTILCKGGEPGLHTCYVMVCGGAYGGDPICCPEGYPKLNECDCNCYKSNAEFECKRYAACQYSHKAKGQ